MSFKKISIEDIKYSMMDNLIGLPFIGQNNQKSINEESYMKIEKLTDSKRKTGKIIPVMFRRNEFLKSKFDGSPIESRLEDSIMIQNLSSKDKLWNINLDLDEISKKVFINELLPNQEWRQNIKEETEVDISKKIKITEKISKKEYIRDISQKNDLYLEKNGENILFFVITIENTSEFALSKIMINKMLPRGIQELMEVQTNIGMLEKNINRIKWNIEFLEAKESAKMEFKIKLAPQPTNSGLISLQYRVNLKNSDLYHIKSFEAAAKIVNFIHINEKDEEPGKWDCSISLLNQSDYGLIINKIDIFRKTLDGLVSIHTSEGNALLVDPYSEKVIFEKVIESEERPKIVEKLDYCPKIKIINDFSVSQTMEDEKIELLDIKAEKVFLKDTLKSYENDKIPVAISVENNSTLPINHLFIKEYLPKEFKLEDIMDVELVFKNKKLKFGDYLKKYNKKTIKQEFEELVQLLNTKKEKYLEVRERVLDENKNLEILSNDYSPSEIPLLNDSIKDIDEKIENSSKDLTKNSSELQSLNKKISDLDTKKAKLIRDLKKSNDILDIKKENDNINSEISSLEKEIDQIKKNLDKEIKNRDKSEESINKLKSEISDYEKELKKEDLPEDDKKSIEKKVKKSQKSLSKEEKSISDSKQTISSTEKDLKDKNSLLGKKKKSLKKDNSKESIKDLDQSIQSINQELKSIDDEIEKIEKQKSKMTGSLPEAQKELEDLKHSKNDMVERLNKQTDLLSKMVKKRDEIQSMVKSLNELKSDYSELVIKKSRLNILNEKQFSGEKVFQELYLKFQEHIESDTEEFKIMFYEDQDNKNWILIQLNNLNNYYSQIEVNDKLEILYTLDAKRPAHNQKYKFPCKIYYNTSPPNKTQTYAISDNFLPQLNILHERHKVSLGKIVDHYDEEGRFQISLLVRNNGNHFIDQLELIDNIPQSSSIENAAYKFSENNVGDGKKEIVWKIDRLGPREEIEVSYLLNSPDNSYNLNSHEIFIK